MWRMVVEARSKHNGPKPKHRRPRVILQEVVFCVSASRPLSLSPFPRSARKRTRARGSCAACLLLSPGGRVSPSPVGTDAREDSGLGIGRVSPSAPVSFVSVLRSWRVVGRTCLARAPSPSLVAVRPSPGLPLLRGGCRLTAVRGGLRASTLDRPSSPGLAFLRLR